jgi:hypothetical protein
MLELRTVWSRWWSLATPLATAGLVALAALLPMATPAMREKFKAMNVVPVSMDRRQSVAMIEGFKKSWWPAIDKAGLKFD